VTQLVGALNAVATALFDRLLGGLAERAPLTALLVVSAVTGLGSVVVFRATSRQARLSTLRARMGGNLLAVWLYRHDTSVVLGLQRAIAADAVRRIALGLPSVLILAVPVALVMAQLDLRFAVRPLTLERAALVTVKWLHPPGSAELIASDGLRVEARVRIDLERETLWRVRAESPGAHRITVRTERGSADKTVLVGRDDGAVSQARTSRLGEAWWRPGEAPLPPDLGIDAIEVAYPPRRLLHAFGADASWVLVFVLGVVASGLVAARALGTVY
jgi:hypothetical protein